MSSTGEPDFPTATPSTASSAPSVAPASPIEAVPLTAELSRIHLTVSKEFLQKLEAVGDAMSHAMPGATPAEILEAGLELLLTQAAKRKALVKKPRTNTRPAKGDHIPAHVRSEVWKRDAGKCQWALASGGICGSTRHLELDHIHPRSMGGASTVDNLRVLCRFHNDLAARLALGDDLMDRYTFGLRGAPRRPGSAEELQRTPRVAAVTDRMVRCSVAGGRMPARDPGLAGALADHGSLAGEQVITMNDER